MSPRVTVDELHGYNFQVDRGEQPVIDQTLGLPAANPDGTPMTQPLWVLTFTDPQTGHRVIVPFTEQGKQELLKQLTGGIIVAQNGAHP